MTQETYDLLERAVQIQLERVEDSDAESKEGKEALTKSTRLVELLITADKDNYDYQDKEERRRIEEERNKAANEVEKDKQKLTPGRAALEIAKIGLPILGSSFMFLTGIGFYYGIEKEGRVTCDGTRMVLRQIPNIFKR